MGCVSKADAIRQGSILIPALRLVESTEFAKLGRPQPARRGFGHVGCGDMRRRRMIPAAFTYHRPTSVPEAISLLAQLGEGCRTLAGGHSLIPMMKLRLATPEHLVDLAGIAELKGIRTDGDDIVVGAMTTQHDLIASE